MVDHPLETPSRQLRHRVYLPALLFASGIGGIGCGSPVFPKQLFTVEATGADYPVMLSKVPARDVGRKLDAESGTHFAQSSQTYSTGYAHVTVTSTQRGQSEMPASEKFAAKVRRSDKWVQIESATYVAEDYSGYGYSSADRNLTMEGKAHQ